MAVVARSPDRATSPDRDAVVARSPDRATSPDRRSPLTLGDLRSQAVARSGDRATTGGEKEWRQTKAEMKPSDEGRTQQFGPPGDCPCAGRQATARPRRDAAHRHRTVNPEGSAAA